MSFEKEFYFNGEPYLPTLQRIHHALTQEGAFVELVGDAGVGKSSICSKLNQYLARKDYWVITFRQGIESVDMLHSLLARELDIAALDNIKAVLSETLRVLEQPVVLIIDDAHLLSDVVLMEIVRLCEDTEHGLRVLLCREASLQESMHTQRSVKELDDRLTDWIHLQPMSAEQLRVFLRAYFDDNGLHGIALEAEAQAQLYRLCRGFPEPALNYAQHLLSWFLGNPDTHTLNRRKLDQIVKNKDDAAVLPGLAVREGIQRNGLLPVGLVVVVASLAFLYQQLASDEPAPPPPAESPFLASEAEPAPGQQANAQLPADPSAGNAVATPDSAADASAEELPVVPVESAAQEPDSISPQQQALARELARQAELRERAEEAVSDSGLALVTAEQRGISVDQFALPEYEELLELAGTDGGQATVAAEPDPEELATDRTEDSETLESPPTEAAVPALAEVEAEVEPEPEIEAETGAESIADATVPVATAEAAPETAGSGQLQATVVAWIEAWQSQSLADYFALYHADFQPRYHDSVTAWRQNRQRVIGNAEFIDLQMRDFEVIEVTDQQAEVHFWLRYESGSYSDDTLKKLVLVAVESGWQILEEVNLEVRVGARAGDAVGQRRQLVAYRP